MMRGFMSKFGPRPADGGGVYGRTTEFRDGPAVVEEEAQIYRGVPFGQRSSGGEAPWWTRQDDIVLPQRRNVTTYIDENPRGRVSEIIADERYGRQQLSPQDRELYRRYMADARPYDVVGRKDVQYEDDSMTSWSGLWRTWKEPYYQRTDYRPPQREYREEFVEEPAEVTRQFVTRSVEVPQEYRRQVIERPIDYMPSGFQRRTVY